MPTPIESIRFTHNVSSRFEPIEANLEITPGDKSYIDVFTGLFERLAHELPPRDRYETIQNVDVSIIEVSPAIGMNEGQVESGASGDSTQLAHIRPDNEITLPFGSHGIDVDNPNGIHKTEIIGNSEYQPIGQSINAISDGIPDGAKGVSDANQSTTQRITNAIASEVLTVSQKAAHQGAISTASKLHIQLTDTVEPMKVSFLGTPLDRNAPVELLSLPITTTLKDVTSSTPAIHAANANSNSPDSNKLELGSASRHEDINFSAKISPSGEQRQKKQVATEKVGQQVPQVHPSQATNTIGPGTHSNEKVPLIHNDFEGISKHQKTSGGTLPNAQLAATHQNAINLPLEKPSSSAETLTNSQNPLIPEQVRPEVQAHGGPATLSSLGTTSQAASPNASLTHSVAQQIRTAVETQQGNDIQIRLDPEELGKIRMILSTRDGAMNVTIFAERPETLDLMRRNSEDLSVGLNMAGFGDANLHFDQGHKNDNEVGEVDIENIADTPPSSPDYEIRNDIAIASDGLDLRI